MALENHVESLRQKHAELDEKITEQYARPLPDEIEIKRLKIAKLQIKEEITGLTNGSGQH